VSHLEIFMAGRYSLFSRWQANFGPHIYECFQAGNWTTWQSNAMPKKCNKVARSYRPSLRIFENSL